MNAPEPPPLLPLFEVRYMLKDGTPGRCTLRAVSALEAWLEVRAKHPDVLYVASVYTGPESQHPRQAQNSSPPTAEGAQPEHLPLQSLKIPGKVDS